MTQPQSNTIIDVKSAIRIAREYLLNLYDGTPLPNFLLEEVERTDDDQFWLITYGFDTTSPTQAADDAYTQTLTGIRAKYVREYKLVKVRASDGEVQSMTIRQI